MTSFAWDWASGLPEMLSEGGNLYLVGHETLGQWDGSTWAYYLPDALGSVRQATDGAGAVTGSREWTPFGVEVGTAQGGLGYTGEWFDGSAGFTYLRARWYDGSTGQFTQADLSRAEQNLYLYARANPVIFTDPAGTCALQPGGRTCAVEPGDRLYQIARDYIALGYHIDPITKILDWNPQFPPPAYQIYGSNIVNLCDPNDPTCPGSSGGHSAPPGDWWYGTSGYLEGWMVSVSGGLFGCGAQFVLGQEVVYDFATKPPQRAMFRFVSRDRPGVSGSPAAWFDSNFLRQWAIKGSLSVYAGFIWGFPERGNIEKDYGGFSTSGSVGLTLDVPMPQAPYVSMGLEAGIGKFKSDTNQVQGYVGYVSGGVQVGVPSAGFGMATSVIKTNYTMYPLPPTEYGSWEQPDLKKLGNHIRNGDGTPLVNAIVGFLGGPIVSEYVRNPAAEIGAWVVTQHYARGGQ